ncbi:alpha/beta hydrolase [Kitasatospora griseola]|uniref:Alpha/beta hydrolase n=1 Tax=Kitasatospora griseola TaxID=2064 RepID=A0A0D0P2S5_KITGR|nr:alpha/beta hydrolase [Kitasatospora griseola]KIQ65946.1 alpha/beta hydrolase [Kitasatospora griseola]
MSATRPTVVLVHDGCSDATTWAGVVAELHRRGLNVLAAANPLRGLAHDAAYLAALLAGLDGPVVLVGHAYGGAVITEAGGAPNVVALVYVAAYLPDVGESYDDLVAGLAPGQGRARLLRTGAGDELTVPRERFPELVAADLDPELAQVLAALQRPVAERVFTETPTAAAWRDKPSWALVTGADQALPPEVQRFTAERAGAPVTELREASHAVIVSRPTAVAELIHEVATGR